MEFPLKNHRLESCFSAENPGVFQTGTDEHNGFTVSKVCHGDGIVEADFVAQ